MYSNHYLVYDTHLTSDFFSNNLRFPSLLCIPIAKVRTLEPMRAPKVPHSSALRPYECPLIEIEEGKKMRIFVRLVIIHLRPGESKYRAGN